MGLFGNRVREPTPTRTTGKCHRPPPPPVARPSGARPLSAPSGHLPLRGRIQTPLPPRGRVAAQRRGRGPHAPFFAEVCHLGPLSVIYSWNGLRFGKGRGAVFFVGVTFCNILHHFSFGGAGFRGAGFPAVAGLSGNRVREPAPTEQRANVTVEVHAFRGARPLCPFGASPPQGENSDTPPPAGEGRRAAAGRGPLVRGEPGRTTNRRPQPVIPAKAGISRALRAPALSAPSGHLPLRGRISDTLPRGGGSPPQRRGEGLWFVVSLSNHEPTPPTRHSCEGRNLARPSGARPLCPFGASPPQGENSDTPPPAGEGCRAAAGRGPLVRGEPVGPPPPPSSGEGWGEGGTESAYPRSTAPHRPQTPRHERPRDAKGDGVGGVGVD